MRARILIALLTLGAAACGDTGTSPVGQGSTGVTGGRGDAGGASGVNPNAALASSVNECPKRCALRVGEKAGLPSAQAAESITEGARVLLTGGNPPVRWGLSSGSQPLEPAAGYTTFSRVYQQNGWGQVVGRSTAGDQHVVTAWEPNGEAIVLSDRPTGGLPLAGEARAITDNSVIVGVSGDRAFRTHYQEGFRWLAGAGSGAVDVNYPGQVVGYTTVGNARHATLWSREGVATDLGVLAGYAASEAVAISETGIVVGFSNNGDVKQGFIWTASGGMKALDAGFVPSDVNHWGEVAGQFPATGACAVYYEGYGTLELPRSAGTASCGTTSINSWGDVAGYERFSPNGGRTYVGRPLVWAWTDNRYRYGF